MQKEIGGFFNEFETIQKYRQDFNSEIDTKTKKYQKQYGFEIGTGEHATWNNESDAFKHAFMQAVLYHRASKKAPFLKNEIGSTYSKTIGDYHEEEVLETKKGEKNMDLWNNEVGRDIAKSVRTKLGPSADKLDDTYIENLFAAEIIKRMKKGELITKPNDMRKFEDRYKYNMNISKPSGEYHSKNGHWITTHGHHVFIDK